MNQLVLHNYFRSSTSVRVRVALNLKGLAYSYKAYHLRDGQQRSPDYLLRNAQGLVPSLELVDGTTLTQSLAIMEYLDETHPEPPLLPADAVGRARVRALACAVACEIHPLNNLRVLGDIRTRFNADDAAVAAWFRHWVAETFGPLERQLAAAPERGRFCHGNAPGLADICLFAQVINNRRFDVDMAPYPTIREIFGSCLGVAAFEAALPANQPDAE